MPPLPATPGVARGDVYLTLLAAGGDEATVSVPVNTEASTAQLDEMWLRIGNLSNAAAFKQGATAIEEWSKATVNPYDESYSSAETKMLLTFQNELLETFQIAVPAPDETYFQADGVTVNPTNVNVGAATTAINAYRNAGDPAGTWAFLYGQKMTISRKKRKPKTVRASVEPTNLQLPPPSPGT